MHKTLFLFLFASTALFAMEQEIEEITQGIENQKLEDNEENKSRLPIFPQAHFSPRIADVVNNLIDNEKSQTAGAMYRFTLYDVAKKLVEKKKEDIDASFILDKDFEGDSCAAIRLMIQNKISVYKQNTTLDRVENNEGYYNPMHHKFLIFVKNITDKPLVLTGSFNLTGQANNKNAENVVILDDTKVIAQFCEEFNLLRENSALVAVNECKYNGKPKSDMSRRINNIPNGIAD